MGSDDRISVEMNPENASRDKTRVQSRIADVYPRALPRILDYHHWTLASLHYEMDRK